MAGEIALPDSDRVGNAQDHATTAGHPPATGPAWESEAANLNACLVGPIFPSFGHRQPERAE